MKIPVPRYHSPLGRLLPNTADIETIKQNGWCDQHILVISENDDRLDFVEREIVRRIGNRLYGSVPRSESHE